MALIHRLKRYPYIEREFGLKSVAYICGQDVGVGGWGVVYKSSSHTQIHGWAVWFFPPTNAAADGA